MRYPTIYPVLSNKYFTVYKFKSKYNDHRYVIGSIVDNNLYPANCKAGYYKSISLAKRALKYLTKAIEITQDKGVIVNV